MSIADKIQRLQAAKTAIATAITNKGGTVASGDGYEDFATDIATIPSGGGSPVISSLTVTPSTSQQTITATGGTDGYSPITVNAVTSSIDNNITAGNIKKDVVILGVTGTYEGGGGTDNLPSFISDGISTFTDNNITKICAYAFYYHNSSSVTNPLTSVSCANVENIGIYAFHYCSNLTSVDFPKCKTIGNFSFMNSGVTSFTTTDNLTNIGQNAFASCSSLTSFTIPKNVTSIGNSALTCTNITILNYNAKNVGNFSNSNNNVFSNLGKNTSGTTFNIGETVEHIPDYLLYSNTTTSNLPKITTLNFPVNNNINSIGQYAFFVVLV